jgi:CBS domain-containing protein
MNVGEICSRPAVTVSPSATLAEVARTMCNRHVGAVIVTKVTSERPIPIGIITDRDIVRAQLERTHDLSSLSAEQVMTRDPLVVRTDHALSDAIQRLAARNVRRAPVIASDGSLVGLVSTDDLLRHIADEMKGIANLLARHLRRETRERDD